MKATSPLIDRIESALSETDRDALRQRALADTYFFAKFVIGYKDLSDVPHQEVCQFLDARKANRRMMLNPRATLKTSLLKAWEVQQVCRDPNERILHVMSSAGLAETAGRGIDQIFRNNEMLNYLFPERIPEWSRKDLIWNLQQKILPRTIISGDPTFHHVGTGTKITGMHYRIIILDDFIEAEAAGSEVVMEAACDWAINCEPLLEVPDRDQILVVGTRWSKNDYYGRLIGPRLQNTNRKLFRGEGDERYLVMQRAIEEDGVPFWPDRFPHESVVKLKRSMEAQGKKAFFFLQYMNRPLAEDLCAFPLNMVRRYEWNEKHDKLILHQPKGPPVIIPFSSLILTMTVDPTTTAGKRSDSAAICVIGTHPKKGYRINVYSWKGKCTPDKLVEKIFGIVKGFQEIGKEVWRVAIEKVMGQDNLNYFIDSLSAHSGVYIPLYRKLKTSNKQNLDERIAQMVHTVAAGLYYTNDYFTEANNEMETFTIPSTQHPDWLSAFSYQPQVWPETEAMDGQIDGLIGATADQVDEDDEEQEQPWHAGKTATGYG